MAEEDIDVEFDSDDDVTKESHNKLLSAVSRLYKKQRVENAKRTEPSREVSEFNLAAPGNDDKEENDYVATAISTVGLGDLLSTLNHGAKQKKIKTKMNAIKGQAATLPPPLERNESEKIKRSVGYDNVKSHVSRWDGLVEKNQLSLELSFPLQKPPEVVTYEPLSFTKTFTKPNDLELKLAEVLKTSEVHKKEEEVESSLAQLSLKEMIQQRRLMKKIKAQESFKIVKAMKQNKIKSKKYRRLLRKEKAKMELKEFEALKAADPEAALEKLEKDERERALERASLRHRNTGRWAKGLAVRAKYDREARKELADQVAKSREITRKKMLEEEKEDEDSEEEYSGKIAQEFGDNPWLDGKTPDDMTVNDFMAGCTMFWKAKKASEDAEEKEKEDSKVKGLVKSEPAVEVSYLSHTLQSAKNLSDKGDIQKKVLPDISNETSVPETHSEESTNTSLKNGHESTIVTSSSNKEKVIDPIVESADGASDGVTSHQSTSCESGLQPSALKSTNNDEASQPSLLTSLDNKTRPKEKTESHKSSFVSPNNLSDSNSSKSSPKKLQPPKERQKIQTEVQLLKSKDSDKNNDNDFIEDLLAVSHSDDQNTEEIIFNTNRPKPNKSNIKISNISSKQKSKIKRAQRKGGSWKIDDGNSVSNNVDNTIKKTVTFSDSPKKIEEELEDIDDLFENMEDSIKNKLIGRVTKINKTSKEKGNVSSNLKRKDANEDFEEAIKPKKKKINKIEVNKEVTRQMVNENTDKRDEMTEAMSTLNDLSEEVKDGPTNSKLINPNEFMVVRPRRMANEIGDISVPSELVDDDVDDETTGGNTAKDFEEAFADDDLVNDFRNEKASAENVKHEIDLTLPGWGSWAGSGINENSKRRRKRKKKFVLAFAPTQPAQPKKENVILNEDAEAALTDIKVKNLPAPYSKSTFQMTMQVPLGRDWQSEVAVRSLTRLPVRTRAGHIIQPMSEEQLQMYDKNVNTAVYNFEKNKAKKEGEIKNKRKPLG